MTTAVFIRSGASAWGAETRLAGWTDIDLSEQGVEEARSAGKMLKRHGYHFDLAFTSMLTRAIRTLYIVQGEMDRMWTPIQKDWRLNERHYGMLQGLTRFEIEEHYGRERVGLWEQGPGLRPPAMSTLDPRCPHYDPRYSHVRPENLPYAESLQDTARRVIACWDSRIAPHVQAGRSVLVVAHDVTIQTLTCHLDAGAAAEGSGAHILTGIPLVYEFSANMRVSDRFYLGGQQVETAIGRVFQAEDLIA